MAVTSLLEPIARTALIMMRLVLFALALGLTIISYQAYSERGTKRLESAFVGFAFISMGVAVSTLNSDIAAGLSGADILLYYLFQVAEAIPFIIGFSMLYYSMYR